MWTWVSWWQRGCGAGPCPGPGPDHGSGPGRGPSPGWARGPAKDIHHRGTETRRKPQSEYSDLGAPENSWLVPSRTAACRPSIKNPQRPSETKDSMPKRWSRQGLHLQPAVADIALCASESLWFSCLAVA